MDDQESVWWDLCRRAWVEGDPVKFLDVSMKINQFLARKQKRLDAEFDEAERRTK
jgi:hypothetical protein